MYSICRTVHNVVKMSKYLIVKDFVTTVKRYGLKGHQINFKIKPIPANENPVEWIKDAIMEIVEYATQDLLPTDKVGLSFCTEYFSKGQGWLSFRNASDVKTEDVWNIISSIFQSNSNALSTDTFCMAVTSVRLPKGKGKISQRRNKYSSFSEECAMRKGIIVIHNKDNMCLPRAIVVSLAHSLKDPEYKKIRKDTGKLQLQKAKKLLDNSNIAIPSDGAGIEELQLFQKYLNNHKITVYKYGSKGREVLFEGSIEEGTSKINLIYSDGHYNVITSLTAAFACSYYCEDCHIPYDHKNKHRCGGSCPCCQQSPACVNDINQVCKDCNRKFRSSTCFENHKKPGSMGKDSVCDQVQQCKNCFKTTQKKRNHICGEVFCKICNSHVQADHLCYMQIDAGHPKIKDTLFVFFDFETRQEVVTVDGSKLHEPNLCVFKQYCAKCLTDKNEIQMCTGCGIKLHIIKHNPVENFMQFVLNQRKIFKQVVCIAHNGQGFDFQLILRYILEETNLKPELLMRGTKIILMAHQNIKFIDSLNYFPMSLAKFPSAFDLDSNFKKGYFPHLFNTKDNETYIGPLPEYKYYDPDSMKDDDRSIFLNWYEENKKNEFNMQRDIVEYCVSDVDILAQACIKFRELLLQQCNVCPFTDGCTIASACNKVFRRNFLKPNTIGIIPKNGYRYSENQSKLAIQWLIREEIQRGINIQHAAKQKEAVLNGIKVDGYCAETKQVFQFSGCWFHGCLSCYPYKRNEPMYNDNSETLNSRYESTVSRKEQLRKLGYEVLEMWECQFKKELQENQDLTNLTKNHPLLCYEKLNPRDAFYGGRTGNAKTYYKCKTGEKIKYIDVNSLYPYICKYGKFPVKHPKVYVGEECYKMDLGQTVGLIKCEILPPQELYHPVLPTKMNQKLMFLLCRSCGEYMWQGDCMHNENERSLTGTWVIDEVNKAIEKGYKILSIHEIWQYEFEQFNPEKMSGGLFTEMMDTFIKMKQEASGWPSSCTTLEAKNKYINDFLHKEGIQLDFNNISTNSGLRFVAKLMLNSFWGKLGQRENQSRTSVINQPHELYELLTNSAISVNTILPINDETVIVSWAYIEEAFNVQKNVNVCIAAFTTAQARLKLYSYLEQLEERAVYWDTDSVIYISNDNENNFEPVTGNFLGDMTNELENYGPDTFISEFVSGGPKNYAFKLFSKKHNEEKTICKVKGICLNYTASKLVNMEVMKNMVIHENLKPITVSYNAIRRTSDHRLVTRKEEKLYKPNSVKRKFFSNGESIPFGYKKQKVLE